MKTTISTLLFTAVATTICSAFAPSLPVFVSSKSYAPLYAEAEKKEVVLDKNFDDVNIVKLLGLRRLKKKMRKNKSKANRGK